MTYKKTLNNFKHNYFKSVFIVFICMILLSGGVKLLSKNILKNKIT